MQINERQSIHPKTRALASFCPSDGTSNQIGNDCMFGPTTLCFWGDDMHEVLPNSEATALQHLKAVKNPERIHDEIKAPKTRRMDRKPAS